ncbi:hypothetical protein [Undibacterium sp. Ren11W]|uniref:hypothetical protein n=1 Tax=Undibacterium sp. Ren11W TaxID=3413045 RepID=UPI003BEF9FFA
MSTKLMRVLGREQWRSGFYKTLISVISVVFGGLSLYSALNLLEVHAQGVSQVSKTKLGDSKSDAEYSWRLFVQAVSPSGNPQRPLAFETWQEQCDLQPALCGLPANSDSASVLTTSGASPAETSKTRPRRGHGSALARSRINAGHNDVNVSCSAMNTTGFPPIAFATNVTPKAVFCEEIFVNQTEAGFILANRLTTISGQQAYGNITFPTKSIEIKVDWVPQSSFTTPFSCDDPSLYIETIAFEGQPKQCYAMVGMHISSKVLPNWLWATFEPNNLLTNPNRCNPMLYGECEDTWGTTSAKPYGPGATPAQSPELAKVMRDFKLPAAFNNYFLTGVQTEFVKQGKATQLGNSFVEFNAGVSPQQASCITCHAYAYAGIEKQFIGGPLPGWPNIGYACKQAGATKNCLPTKSASGKLSSEDFSWMLGIMP